MSRTACTLTSLLLFASVPALADSIDTGGCPGAQIYGDAEVPIQITPKTIRTATTAKKVLDYKVSLGPDNSLECLCLHGDATVVLTLPHSGRYEFRDIQFEYPYGFEPAYTPFKLSVVRDNSLLFHMESNAASDGLRFKYTVTVKDRQTGSLLIIDPTVTNRPRPPRT